MGLCSIGGSKPDLVMTLLPIFCTYINTSLSTSAFLGAVCVGLGGTLCISSSGSVPLGMEVESSKLRLHGVLTLGPIARCDASELQMRLAVMI